MVLMLSEMVVSRDKLRPISESAAPKVCAWLLSVRPLSSSVPIEMSSMGEFMGNDFNDAPAMRQATSQCYIMRICA